MTEKLVFLVAFVYFIWTKKSHKFVNRF